MKICPTCGEIIKGRRDKIFCSPNCRSSAQYEKKVMHERFYLQVDKQLKTNRKILKRYNKSGFTTLRKEKLLEEGFNPKFFTQIGRTKRDRCTYSVMTLAFWK